MKLKATIPKQEFFNKLMQSKCKFKKIAGLYPTNCKKVKYIGQLKDFYNMDVFQIDDEEALFFKSVFKLFKDSKITIELKEKG